MATTSLFAMAPQFETVKVGLNHLLFSLYHINHNPWATNSLLKMFQLPLMVLKQCLSLRRQMA